MGMLSCLGCFGPSGSESSRQHSLPASAKNTTVREAVAALSHSANRTPRGPHDSEQHARGHAAVQHLCDNDSEVFHSFDRQSDGHSEAFNSCLGSFSSIASAARSSDVVMHLADQTAGSKPPAPAQPVDSSGQVPAVHASDTPVASVSASELETLLRDAAALYRRHPCRAYQVVLQYCEQQGTTPTALARKLPAPTDTPSYTLHRLLTMAASLQLGLNTVLDHSSWSVVRADKLKIWYKHTKGTTEHHFKGQCTLETPIDHVIAVAREFDLVKTWNHYLLESNIVYQHSPAEMLCQAVSWMPWPMHNMEILAEAAGCDMLDSVGAFMVAMQLTDDPMPGIELPTKKGVSRNSIKMLPGSCMRFQPLPPSKPGGHVRVEVTLQSHMDFGIKYIPGFIITFMLKVLSPYLYTQVVKVLDSNFRDKNDPLPTRMRENAAFYELIAARTTAHLSKVERLKRQTDLGVQSLDAELAPT